MENEQNMQTQKVSETITKQCPTTIAEIRISRTERGIKLYLKSEQIESLFKRLSGEQREVLKIGQNNERVYRPLDEVTLMSRCRPSAGMADPDTPVWTRSSGSLRVNMVFLRIAGIEAGKTVELSGVFSDIMMDAIKLELKLEIIRLYQMMIKPRLVKVTINAEDAQNV